MLSEAWINYWIRKTNGSQFHLVFLPLYSVYLSHFSMVLEIAAWLVTINNHQYKQIFVKGKGMVLLCSCGLPVKVDVALIIKDHGYKTCYSTNYKIGPPHTLLYAAWIWTHLMLCCKHWLSQKDLIHKAHLRFWRKFWKFSHMKYTQFCYIK
jgi:hypothetical protein